MPEDKTWINPYISAYLQDRARGIPPSTKEESRYRNAISAKHYPYTYDDLEYYHLYCLTYRDNVRNGYKPSAEEDAQFNSFSGICYQQGVAYVA